MDAKQEFYDKLFEHPDTINGLYNKLRWLLKECRKESNEFYNIIKNEINETYDLLRYIREDNKQ